LEKQLSSNYESVQAAQQIFRPSGFSLTVVVHVYSYNLQIFIIFLLDKEAINSSELSALFAARKQVTYQNNVSFTTMTIKKLELWCLPVTEKTSSD
jgi:hypothetical protein